MIFTLVPGDEYREGKVCMSSILSSERPVNIGEMTTDRDSDAYKRARDAQLQITVKPMARMADVIHLTKLMQNKLKKMNFSQQMFNVPNQKEYKFLRVDLRRRYPIRYSWNSKLQSQAVQLQKSNLHDYSTSKISNLP